jgi:hypothetical protein
MTEACATRINGAWVLPRTEDHTDFFSQLAEIAREHGGSATVLVTQNLKMEERDAILERFRADRAREYDEFAECSRSFQDEIERETRRGKFTFAELEEVEDDFAKLSSWLGKIRARDFFPDNWGEEASATLAECERALRAFSGEIYSRDTATMPADDAES